MNNRIEAAEQGILRILKSYSLATPQPEGQKCRGTIVVLAKYRLGLRIAASDVETARLCPIVHGYARLCGGRPRVTSCLQVGGGGGTEKARGKMAVAH